MPYLKHIACTFDDCDSSDGMALYEEEERGVTGFCWACNRYEAHPLGKRKEEPAAIEITFGKDKEPWVPDARFLSLATLPSKADNSRALSDWAMAYFGVKTELSETDGTTVTAHYYPYTKGSDDVVAYKHRELPKKFSTIGDFKSVDLFGLRQALNTGGRKVFITEGECFPGDAEVLTPNGWTAFSELGDEDVMMVDAAYNGAFTKPLDKIHKKGSFSIVRQEAKGYVSETTEGHSLVYETHSKRVKLPASDKPKTHWNIPRVVYNDAIGLPLSEDQIALCLALSADFKFDERKSGEVYAHACFLKQRKKDRLVGILNRLKIKFTTYEQLNEGYTSFNLNVPQWACTRMLPWSFVSETSLDQKRFILDELVFWDGNSVPNRDQFEYSTKYKHNADVIQTIAHTSGYCSSIIPRKNEYGEWLKVSILFGKQTTGCQHLKRRISRIVDEVFCVSVPSGMLLVRQEGKITVTGNCDAVALFQALKSFSKGGEWADLNPAVVSLPNGGAAALAAITRNLDQLRKFEHIVLVMDNDEVGQKAKADILKLIPEALTVTLDEKDPNAMVMKGKNVNLAKACLFQAQRQRPSSIASVSDLRARALAKPAMGLSWPWPTLTKETYGIHTKKLYVIGAGVGLGKSEVVNEVVAHLIYEHDAHVGVFKLEEDGGRTLKGLAGKRDGVVYHNPEIPYDEEKLIESIDALEGKLLVYDHFGVKEWEDLKPAIRYMVVTEGVKHIFLDPLTAVVSGLSSGEANDKLNQIMGDLSGMTHELDFSCYVISHLNLPDKGLPHELGGKALESQMTGSRAMMKYAHYIFMLQGNKDPELPEDARNCRELVCRKDREFGRVFTVDMFYDNRTGLLRERAVKFGNY